jgi:predicted nucleic acid-binding protein
VLAVVDGVGREKNFMNEGNSFADTNVLVYAFDTSTPDKQRTAQQLLQLEGSRGKLILSTQVLQEFLVTVTRKLPQPLSLEIAYEAVRNLAEYPLVQIDKNLILRAIKRQGTDQFSFWDALIIEAALQSHCQILLTEDLQDGRKIGGLRITNPFV